MKATIIGISLMPSAPAALAEPLPVPKSLERGGSARTVTFRRARIAYRAKARRTLSQSHRTARVHGAGSRPARIVFATAVDPLTLRRPLLAAFDRALHG